MFYLKTFFDQHIVSLIMIHLLKLRMARPNLKHGLIDHNMAGT